MNAVLSGSSGVALVLDEEALWSMHADGEAELIERRREEIPFLLGEARDLEWLEGAEPDEISRHLDLARDRVETLDLALLLLDGDAEREHRLAAAKELCPRLALPEILEFLLAILASEPLPADADVVGARSLLTPGLTAVRELLGYLGSRQKAIGQIHQAWLEASARMYSSAEERDATHSLAAREGLFRDLVEASFERAPLVAFVGRFLVRKEVRRLPHARELLDAWVSQVEKASRRRSFRPMAGRRPAAMEVAEPVPPPWPAIAGGELPPLRDQVLISYSHKDKIWLDRLETVLKPMVGRGAVAVWSDTRIQPGARWRDEIENALVRAKVAVLLASPDFLASNFLAEIELPQLLAAAERDGMALLWVYVRPCLYGGTPIAGYSAAHDIAKPLAERDDWESALFEIAERIARAAAA